MRLIDADALKHVICDHAYLVQDFFNSIGYGMFWSGGIEKAIDNAPTVDAVPVRHGKWIDKSGGIEGAWNHCSVCGERAIELYDYCPNCGAKMEADNETD